MKTVTERQVRSALWHWKRLSECGRPAAKMTHREIAARAFELLKDIYGDDVRMFSWHVHAPGGEPRRIDLGFSRENVFRWDGAGGWDSVSFETEPVDAATLKDGDLEILSSAGLRMTGNESGPAFAEAKDALERIGRGWTTPITFSIKYVVNVSLDVEDPDAFREWLEEDEVLVESEGHAGRKSFSKEQKKNVAEAVTDLARDVFGDDIRLDGYDIPDTVVPGTEIVLTFGRESSFTWICNGSNPRRECDNPKLVSDRYVKLDPAPVSKLLDGDIELFRTAGLEVVFERRPDGRHLELPYADAAVSKACWEIGDRSILAVLNRGDVYDFSYDFKIGFRVTDLGAFCEWLDDDGEVLTESEGSAVVLDEDGKDRLCAALTDIARDIFGDGLEFRYHTLSVAAKRLMQGSRFSLTFRKESDFEWTGEPFFIDDIDDQMIEEMTKFGSEPVDDLQSGDLSLLDGTGLSIRKHLYAGRMTLEKWYAVQKVRQCFAEWPSDSIDTGEAFEFEYFFPVEFEVVDIARFSDWVDGLGQDDGELEEAETRPAFETFFVAGGPKQVNGGAFVGSYATKQDALAAAKADAVRRIKDGSIQFPAGEGSLVAAGSSGRKEFFGFDCDWRSVVLSDGSVRGKPTRYIKKKVVGGSGHPAYMVVSDKTAAKQKWNGAPVWTPVVKKDRTFSNGKPDIGQNLAAPGMRTAASALSDSRASLLGAADKACFKKAFEKALVGRGVQNQPKSVKYAETIRSMASDPSVTLDDMKRLAVGIMACGGNWNDVRWRRFDRKGAV